MRVPRIVVVSSLALLMCIPASALRTRRSPTSGSSHRKTKTKRVSIARPRAIDDARATEIQGALIKAGYLSGEPSGHWDSTSEAAMQKLQSDNGWQTKLIPDSRALIKLGLGNPSAAGKEPISTAPAAFATNQSPSLNDTQEAHR